MRSKYDEWCHNVRKSLRSKGCTEEELRALNVKMHYTENEYSENDTVLSVRRALRDTISVLQEMGDSINGRPSEDAGIRLIEKVLNNFHMYYQAMYRNPVHKKGTMAQSALKAIEIGNEYDLQRMLYSLLLPIFPTARQEVENDNGYSTMRADLYVDDYDVAIEIKCTRNSMSEKTLIDELGADGFHYKASTIFFFVYDKIHMTKNPAAFQKAFARERNTDGKMVRLVVLQPKEF